MMFANLLGVKMYDHWSEHPQFTRNVYDDETN